MISFRYHAFTVVAIFLAVALGIAIGNTGLSRSVVVRGLERQTEELQQQLDETRATLSDARATVERLEQATDVLPMLVDGDLAGHRVVLVTHAGVDGATLSQVSRALDAAGAELAAAFAVTVRMAATEQEDRDLLADLFGMVATDDPAPLVERATAVIADRLTEGPQRRGAQPEADDIAQPEEDDILDGLLRAAFLSLPDGSPSLSEGDLEDLGGNGELLVVVAGGEEEPLPSADGFLVPLVRELVAQGAPVAAAESAGTTYPFVATLRADEAVHGRIVTVDDADLSIGGAALVLGLERLIAIGQGGDYGFKGSDVTPLPPP